MGNLDTSTFVVVLTLIFGAGTLSVAILNAIIGRGSRKVDIADKVTEAADRVFTRYDKDIARLDEQVKAQETRAIKCESRQAVTERQLSESQHETRRIKTAFRVYMTAVESGDSAALAVATVAAHDLLL